MIVTLVVIYIISSQSKLKTLLDNIALQHIRAIEAFNPKYQDVHCDFGMLKYIMILILVAVIILAFGKVRKRRIFRGWLFSNIVKIELFIADAQSYVPIELIKIAGNVHLFKLTGVLLLENINLRKKLDLVCIRGRLEWCPCDIEWKRNKFAYIHCNTACW